MQREWDCDWMLCSCAFFFIILVFCAWTTTSVIYKQVEQSIQDPSITILQGFSDTLRVFLWKWHKCFHGLSTEHIRLYRIENHFFFGPIIKQTNEKRYLANVKLDKVNMMTLEARMWPYFTVWNLVIYCTTVRIPSALGCLTRFISLLDLCS